MLSNYNEFKDYIKTLENKPKLLLHVCCAPCSSHVLLMLKDIFDITIYYSNDNIYPKEEFDFRLDEVNKFASNFNIKVLDDGFCQQDYYDAVKGYENLGEKSIRCYFCYQMRLKKTALKAKELGFDFFTTVLSISPYKNSDWINEIGYNLEKEYNVKFLYSNFKKENGYKHSCQISKEYNMYRQDYCGCVFSYNERNKKNESHKED